MRNQLGRRNLSTFDRVQLISSMEAILSKQAADKQKKAGKHGKEGGRGKKKEVKPFPTNGGEGFSKHSGEVGRQLAKEAGVGYNTLRKGKVVIKKADPVTVAQVRKGEIRFNSRELQSESRRK